jgi:2-keto-3-deoxy-L-rhamnonate aldolase RhmA
MVETAEDARKAVASARYPPHYGRGKGTREYAYTMVRASQCGRNEQYDSNCHEVLLTIVQVEAEEAIHNILEIGMVEGVDCMFLGPFDISFSIGELGDFSEDGKKGHEITSSCRAISKRDF